MRRIRESVCWPLKNSGHAAYHEAGHLVAAHHGGMRTAGAIVHGPTGAAAVGMGIHAPRSIDKQDLERPATAPGLLADLLTASYPACWPGKTFEEAGIAYATMLVAGRQAELLHAGIRLTNSQRLVMRDSDHLLAEVVLNRVGLNYLALGYCQQKAREILTDRWDEVQRLADQLQAGAA